MNWVAVYTIPQHRCEFTVLHRIHQNEYPAHLPFETVMEVRPGTKEPIERKYARFPRYVFVGMRDVAADYAYLSSKIPEIQGIVSLRRGEWSPRIMTPRQVAALEEIMAENVAPVTETNIHKAFREGREIEVKLGSATRTTKVHGFAKGGVEIILDMLGKSHVVIVPFSSVKVA